MDSDLLERPAHLVNRAARLLQHWGDSRLAPLGLAPAQLPVIWTLHKEGALSQTELARLIRTEQPTMSQLLARMERDGLIARKPHPADQRSSLISLTALAKRRMPGVRRLMREGNGAALQGFSKEEIDTLRHLLKRMVANLDEQPRNGERAK